MNKDEKLAKDFLEKYNLEVNSFEKDTIKRPDFKVLAKDGFYFFCEVKSINVKSGKDGILFSTIYNRIVHRIEKANEQFISVNSHKFVPNIMIFISHNFQIHYNTFAELFKGGLILEGKVTANFVKYRDGKLKNMIWNIDLIILLDEKSKPDYFFINNELRISDKFMRIFNFNKLNERIILQN